MSTSVTVGVDAGATLCKLVLRIRTERLETRVFPSTELDAVRACVTQWRPERLAATGAGATRLGSEIDGVRVHCVPEFDAWARGAGLLAERQGLQLPEPYLLVSLGTGTSVLAVRGRSVERVGGTALGGGALLGLAGLLTGVKSFSELTELAARGDRRRVDLLVGDIYAEGVISLPPQLTAASFAKLESTLPADLAAALVGMIGENIGMICGGLARMAEAQAIVYGGSTLAENPALEGMLRLMTVVAGRTPHFLTQGAFCGAIGAAALLDS